MPKRKSIQAEERAVAEPSRRRSLRLSTANQGEEISTPDAQAGAKVGKKATSPKANGAVTNGRTKTETQANKRKPARPPAPKLVEESEPEPEEDVESEPEPESESGPPAKKARSSKRQSIGTTRTSQRKSSSDAASAKAGKATDGGKDNKKAETVKKTHVNGTKSRKAPEEENQKQEEDGSDGGERNYWLLKAEPETRLENGVDVRFSIDDLAAKTEPEPWDGIRNYVARNNLRAMKKGDLAFFYHSNCKDPGIVGTMEIVQEHSPDLSAHDPKAPYYDAKSKPSDPKWSVVHVAFRSKFAVPISLKELRSMGDAPDKPLAEMQMLKQARLSVSKVSREEWEYLIGVAEERGGSVARK